MRSARRHLARVRKLLLILQTPDYRRGLRFGVAAATEHHRTPLATTYATVVDVGASHGQFALVARHRFPGARLICVEPQPAAARLIERVAGSGVEVITAAAGAQEGEATLHVAAADDSSSLLPIGERQVREFPGTHQVATLAVPLVALDRAVAAPRGPILLKIDVQGGEMAVLLGAERLLDAVATVLVECSFAELYEGQPLAGDIVAFLRDRGFRLTGAFGQVTGRDGAALQADLVFERSRPASPDRP